MKKILAAVLAIVSLLFVMTAFAEDTAAAADAPALTKEYRWFVNKNNSIFGRTVSYYDNVYAYNHGDYYMTPFAGVLPAEYIAIDEEGNYAVASIVLDITDAMRERLYGADLGETILYFGQYCERVRARDGRVGFSGVHEGIDFRYKAEADLHAILGGVVTKAGDKNGTVGVYNEELDVTLLYLHCEEISVKRGAEIAAGDIIGKEGDKGSGSAYTHVELRKGRHTSSNTSRNTKIESDCPYPVMQEALEVKASGRQPVTAAAVLQAQRMREEAEARARAAAEAEAAREKEEEEQIVLVDELPGTQEGYGFEEKTPESVVTPEATLPPSNP